MGECDRALLARAQRLAEDVYLYVSELLAGLPEGEVAVREVAEDVLRLLENPRGVYLAYYPVTPVFFIGFALSYTFILRPRGARRARRGRVVFIVLFEPCRQLSDAELRYVLAHELVHASTHEEEVSADLLAEVLVVRFPEYFAPPDEGRLRVVRQVDMLRLERLVEERPLHLARRFLRCSAALRPVRL
jgi:hypothetical protein